MNTAFQFALQCSDGSTKFVMVEAETEEQAECVEEAVVGGTMAEGCRLLAAFRGCVHTDLFNDAFVTVDFSTFMADLAGFDSMDESTQRKVAAAAEGPCTAPVQIPVREKKALTEVRSENSEKLTFALTALGFKKQKIQAWLKEVGPKVESERLDDLVKAGIAALASPAST